MSYRTELLTRWQEQNRLCIWCGRETWNHTTMSRDEARDRLDITKGTSNATRNLRRRKATAEHIVPKSCGGSLGLRNICCACAECNHTRGNIVDAMTPVPHVAAMLPANVRRVLDGNV